jgi:hypothetical protein
LLEEYAECKEALARSDNPSPVPARAGAQADLLQRRDQFIAGRISATLGAGETGILFIGLIHRVDESLPEDIEVVPLISLLPFTEVRERYWRLRSSKE